jgi:ferredoxin hydrogenase large subunit
MARCVRCANCWRICPQHAIEFQHFSEDTWEEVKSLDMVHCSVCGAPLYTVAFEKSLSEKSVTPLEPLCPKHKQTNSAARQALLISGKGRD